ncbi:2268_t:CDS:2, partial [Acaulospora morrowiae]
IAIRLIAQVQNGQLPDLAHINNDVPLPRFEGVYNKVNTQSSNPALLITNEERERNKRIFNNLKPTNGLLDGESAKTVFQRSNLPLETLGQIWYLADTKKRGYLDVTEFIIAMYFVQRSMNGSIKTLPRSLPAGFYEMAAGVPVNEPTSPNFGVFNVTDSPRAEFSPLMRHSTLHSTKPLVIQDDTWDVSAEEKATFDLHFDTIDTTKKGFLT